MIKLTEYFIKNPRVTNMIVALIFLSGLLSLMTMRREQFPAMSLDIVQVTTVYPGAAPEDVEINVTNKIEDQLMEVENIKKLTSMSMENISIIIARIDSDAGDTEKTKADIRDAIGRVTDLPEAVMQKPLVREIRSTNLPVLEIALSGDVPEKQLRIYARELESRLKEISGVSRIEKIGYRKREIKIDVNMKKMKDNIISFAEVMHAIRARNVRLSGGTLESYVSEKKILTLSEYESLKDIKDVIVRSNFEGYSVRLSDIARVSDDFEEPRILFRSNGMSSLALIVTQQENADIIDLSRNLDRELADFKKTLPGNVRAETIYDYSVITKIMLDMVAYNGIFGFFLVLIVMFIFLDRRSAIWSAFGIPFSFLGALVLFKPLGISLNMITLSTMILVLGIVVDDAIVVTEKIYSMKQSGMDPYKATMEGVKRMLLPVSAAVITSILAFGPILFVPGIMGKFTRGIPMVVTLILLVSLAEAILFIPSHVMHAKVPAGMPRKMIWLEKLKGRYRVVLIKALERRGAVIAAFTALLVMLGILTNFKLKFMLDEDIDIDFFAVVIEAPHGSSLKKTEAMVPAVEKLIIEGIPEEALQSITTSIGHHNVQDLGATAGQYSNWAAVKIYLIPAARRKITSEKIMADLSRKLKILKKEKGFHRLSVEPMAGLPVGKAVSVIFTSNSDDDRGRFEKEVIDFLGRIKGVYNIESSNVAGKSELQLRLNYEKLARMGLTALDVAQTVRTAFDGTVITSIRKDGEDVDFRVRVQNPHLFRSEGVLNLPVANREGRLIMMKNFARIVEKDGPAVIQHYRGKRSVTISADINTKKITSAEVNNLIREKFDKKTAEIAGLSMKLAGQEEEMEAGMQGFAFAFFVAIISIYFILVVLFNSYLQPVLIMSIIPFAVLASFTTLIIHGRPLIFISLMGIMGLIGVVVNDTIVMISHLNKTAGNEGDKYENIADGAMDRFKPVMLTTLTTFAGLLPTCYGIGGDLPTIRPLVLVMAWGLVFSTVVTLVLIPLLYSFVRTDKERTVFIKRIWNRVLEVFSVKFGFGEK